MTAPRIVTRDGWDAIAPRSRTVIPLPAPRLWLHHTAGGEQGAIGMRRIQRFHMDVRGYSDVGYSWVYDRPSRTWFEGRGWGIAGAHTRGDNTGSHGLCVMGNYDTATVDDTLVDDVGWLIASGHVTGKCPARLSGGHRDAPGASTACPGSRLHARIGDINDAVQRHLTTVAPKEVEMVIPKWAEQSWTWAKKVGLVTDKTHPADDVQKVEEIAFLHRYHTKVVGPVVADLRRRIAAAGGTGDGVTLDEVFAELDRRLAE